MDQVIERNTERLRLILAALVAMAGLGKRQSAIASRQLGSGPAQVIQPTPDCRLPTGDSRFSLPRHLRNAVLRLLRPTEAAARRLIVVAARGLVVALQPARARKPGLGPNIAMLRSLGLAVTLSPAFTSSPATRARLASDTRAAAAAKPIARAVRPTLLALIDPTRRFRVGRRTVPPHLAPRVACPGLTPPASLATAAVARRPRRRDADRPALGCACRGAP